VSALSNGGESELDPGMVRVRQRLRALRSRYPGTALTTEISHIHDQQVVVRAILSLPDGTAVTAHASEPIDDTGMLDGPIEQAEWRATTRALDLLGVGDFGAETRRPATERPPARPEPVPHTAPPAGQAGEPEEPQTAPASSAAAEQPEEETVPALDEPDDVDMADYTWTHLWTWARGHGITNRSQVEERIGTTTTGLGPREIHEALRESGLTDD